MVATKPGATWLSLNDKADMLARTTKENMSHTREGDKTNTKRFAYPPLSSFYQNTPKWRGRGTSECIPVVAHGLENGIVELNRSGDEQVRVSGLRRHVGSWANLILRVRCGRIKML